MFNFWRKRKREGSLDAAVLKRLDDAEREIARLHDEVRITKITQFGPMGSWTTLLRGDHTARAFFSHDTTNTVFNVNEMLIKLIEHLDIDIKVTPAQDAITSLVKRTRKDGA